MVSNYFGKSIARSIESRPPSCSPTNCFRLREPTPPDPRATPFDELPQALAQASDGSLDGICAPATERARQRLAEHVDAPRLVAVNEDFDADDGLVGRAGVDLERRELGIAVG
jgi:hypothetical protein